MTKKNLFCIPLIGSETPEDLSNRYWAEVEAQVSRLERSFGEVNKFYHEAVYLAGESGLKNIQKINEKGYQLIKKRTERGAQLEALEDKEIFLKIADCQFFLSLRFSSKDVLDKISTITPEIFKLYEDTLQKRREHILKHISETLKDGETGALLIREEERMKLQFPLEINVILVRPPILSEIEKRQRS